MTEHIWQDRVMEHIWQDRVMEQERQYRDVTRGGREKRNVENWRGSDDTEPEWQYMDDKNTSGSTCGVVHVCSTCVAVHVWKYRCDRSEENAEKW